jgi:hypothetical protein
LTASLGYSISADLIMLLFDLVVTTDIKEDNKHMTEIDTKKIYGEVEAKPIAYEYLFVIAVKASLGI